MEHTAVRAAPVVFLQAVLYAQTCGEQDCMELILF